MNRVLNVRMTRVAWMEQVYYELDEERKRVGANDVAICRMEQLCPVPYDLVHRELKRYPSMLSFS